MNKEASTKESIEYLTESMQFLVEHVATKEDLKNTIEKSENKLMSEIRKSEHRILDGVDDKLSDLKGDMVILMRKEDKKLTNLIDLLKEKKVISKEEAGELLLLEPFPQT